MQYAIIHKDNNWSVVSMSISLVGKTVRSDQRIENGIMLTFDDGTILRAIHINQPVAYEWHVGTQISINGEKIVDR